MWNWVCVAHTMVWILCSKTGFVRRMRIERVLFCIILFQKLFYSSLEECIKSVIIELCSFCFLTNKIVLQKYDISGHDVFGCTKIEFAESIWNSVF